jgi:hypothetical protein
MTDARLAAELVEVAVQATSTVYLSGELVEVATTRQTSLAGVLVEVATNNVSTMRRGWGIVR